MPRGAIEPGCGLCCSELLGGKEAEMSALGVRPRRVELQDSSLIRRRSGHDPPGPLLLGSGSTLTTTEVMTPAAGVQQLPHAWEAVTPDRDLGSRTPRGLQLS